MDKTGQEVCGTLGAEIGDRKQFIVAYARFAIFDAM